MEEKKEKKSKKWILVLILALLLISALAVLGVVFVPKILDSLNIKKGGSSISENTSDTGSYITIDYG